MKSRRRVVLVLIGLTFAVGNSARSGRWSNCWVVLVLIGLTFAVVGLLFFGMKDLDKYYNSHRAIATSRDILLACEAYHEHPESGKQYPRSLTDLVKPPFGGGPFLRSGKADLLDPWGKPYRYAVVRTANGDTELYVWAERAVNGKLKLLGAKMAPGGQTELFGVPDE